MCVCVCVYVCVCMCVRVCGGGGEGMFDAIQCWSAHLDLLLVNFTPACDVAVEDETLFLSRDHA